jgi:integrase
MRLVTAYAPGADPRPLLAAYRAHLDRTGRGNASYWWAARDFFSRWPDPAMWAAEPLEVRLSASCAHRPVITFLMIHGHLRPGYDYLLERKISSLWRELEGTTLGEDLARVLDAAAQLGFSERVATANASQVPARLLIQTGRRLGELTAADLDELAAAGREREQRTGQGWRHYRSGISFTHRVLFHLGILAAPPQSGPKPVAFADRLAGITPGIAAALTSYLNLKLATCKPKTVSSLATRLMHFGRFLTEADPGLDGLAGLDRQRHIEPFLAATAAAADSRTGTAITPGEQQRVLAARNFLTDITAWGWADAPSRQLIFPGDIPKLPRVLPRYLPVDADRRLDAALHKSPYELAACALLQRACGLRIGELLDLELDCVHEVPGSGAWLKVPPGKLDSERMVPLDEETLALIDTVTEIRSPGRAVRHPRYGRPAQFLFTHHGRRLSQNALRGELDRAAQAAGLGHVVPHQLRHTYATAMEMSGVASDASFPERRESSPPALQQPGPARRLGLGRRRGADDLRCHHPVASTQTMMHSDLLHPATA